MFRIYRCHPVYQCSSTSWDSEWQLIRPWNGSLCIDCSPTVQEVPGSIPDWDATLSDALCKECRWLWWSLYILVTLPWCSSHAAACIRISTLHASETHSATIPHRDLEGSCSSTSWDSEWQQICRSNGSLHRMLACCAGGPGFDSRLRRNILRCSMQRM